MSNAKGFLLAALGIVAWCTRHGHGEVGGALDRDWQRTVTFAQRAAPRTLE